MSFAKGNEKSFTSQNKNKLSRISRTGTPKPDTTYKIYSCKLQVKSRKQKVFLKNVFAEARIVHNYFVKQVNLNNINSSIKDSIQFPHISRLAINKIWDDLIERYSKKIPVKYAKAINRLYLGQLGDGYLLHANYNRFSIFVSNTNPLGKSNRFLSFRILGLSRVLDRFRGSAAPKSAYLVAKPSGYYLQILFEISREKVKELNNPEFDYPIAIDFGMSSKITTSNGIKIEFEFAAPDKIEKLENKLKTKSLGRKRTKKIILSIRKLKEHWHNKINDAYHKISKCIFLYKQIIMQNDYMSGWANIKNSFDACKLHILKRKILDRAKSTDMVSFELNQNDNSMSIQNLRDKRLILLSRYERTTKTCFVCENKVDIDKRTRKITCSKCGWTTDRDINATLIMLRKYAKYSSYEILTRFCDVSLDEIYRFYRILSGIREIKINLYADRAG